MVSSSEILSTEFPRLKNICPKGMDVDKCPYNPKLGCDCGFNPPLKWNEESKSYD